MTRSKTMPIVWCRIRLKCAISWPARSRSRHGSKEETFQIAGTAMASCC